MIKHRVFVDKIKFVAHLLHRVSLQFCTTGVNSVKWADYSVTLSDKDRLVNTFIRSMNQHCVDLKTISNNIIERIDFLMSILNMDEITDPITVKFSERIYTLNPKERARSVIDLTCSVRNHTDTTEDDMNTVAVNPIFMEKKMWEEDEDDDDDEEEDYTEKMKMMEKETTEYEMLDDNDRSWQENEVFAQLSEEVQGYEEDDEGDDVQILSPNLSPKRKRNPVQRFASSDETTRKRNTSHRGESVLDDESVITTADIENMRDALRFFHQNGWKAFIEHSWSRRKLNGINMIQRNAGFECENNVAQKFVRDLPVTVSQLHDGEDIFVQQASGTEKLKCCMCGHVKPISYNIITPNNKKYPCGRFCAHLAGSLIMFVKYIRTVSDTLNAGNTSRKYDEAVYSNIDDLLELVFSAQAQKTTTAQIKFIFDLR